MLSVHIPGGPGGPMQSEDTEKPVHSKLSIRDA
jgi:hypothetical protein